MQDLVSEAGVEGAILCAMGKQRRAWTFGDEAEFQLQCLKAAVSPR